MPFDQSTAIQLWLHVLRRGQPWECPSVVEEIAARCGLGVLSIDAVRDAVSHIRQEYYRGRSFDADLLAALDPAVASERWAQRLAEAALRHPTPPDAYPLICPPDHVVGVAPCFKPARKSQWTAACFRAAWGNTEPFGLDQAEKPCPGCAKPMHYWCWGRRGEKPFHWSIDHVTSHAAGGCVCRFNLRAMHPGCNSSKGK